MSDVDRVISAVIAHAFSNSRHLLCVWHIEKKVLAQSKKRINDVVCHTQFIKSWTNVWLSPTFMDFEANRE